MRPLAAALVAAALSLACGTTADPAPCAADAFCPTGHYCGKDGRCAPLPAGFAVTPGASSVTVTAGKVQQLTCTNPGGVAWSVQESGGGTIDDAGRYHAPAQTGTYHVLATSTADSSRTAVVTVTVVPAPLAPAISAPAIVTAGAAGLAASVTDPQDGMSFAWSIRGGTLTQQSGPSVTFSAGAGTTIDLGCTATNAAGDSADGGVELEVVPLPAAPQVAVPAYLTRSGSKTATASVGNAAAGVTYHWSGTNLGPGGLTPAADGASATFTAGPAPGDYSITVAASNAAGDGPAAVSVHGTVVAPADPPAIASSSPVTAGTSGHAAQVTSPQAGVSFSWSITGGSLASSSGASVTFTAGTGAALTLGCRATNLAGDGADSSLPIQVVPLPRKPAVSVPAYATQAGKTQLTATVTNPETGCTYQWTGTNLGGAPQASGASATFTGGPALGDYSVSATAVNAAGDGTASDAAHGTVVAPPPANASLTAPAQASQGKGSYPAFAPILSGITYAWQITNGALTGLPSAPSLTFTAGDPAQNAGVTKLTCTFTNQAGDSSSASAQVTLVALHAAISGAPASVSQGVTYSAAGPAGYQYSWSGSGGVTLVSPASGASVQFKVSPPGGATPTLALQVTNSLGDGDQASVGFAFVPLDPSFIVSTTGQPPVPVSSLSQGLTYQAQGAAGYATYHWTQANGVSFLGSTSAASLQFTAPAVPAGGKVTLTLAVVNSLGDQASQSRDLPVVALDPTISTANTVVTALKAGLTASVGSGYSAYDWSGSAGLSIYAGTGTASVQFTSGPTGSALLSCKVTNSLGDSATGTLPLTVVDPALTPDLYWSRHVLSGRGTASVTASYFDPATAWQYVWGLSGFTQIGTLAQPAFGIAFSGATGTVDLTTVNEAGDAAVTVSASLSMPTGTSGMMVIAGKLGGYGLADGSSMGARLNPRAISWDYNGGYLVGTYLFPEMGFQRLTVDANGVWTVAKALVGLPGQVAYQGFAPIGSSNFFALGSNLIDRYDLSGGVYTRVPITLTGTYPISFVASAISVAQNGIVAASRTGVYLFTPLPAPGASTTVTGQLIAGDASAVGFADAPTGPGTAARFRQISGLLVTDMSPTTTQIIVSDRGASVVRAINLVNGVWQVVTIAGQPDTPGFVDGIGAVARFSTPTGMAGQGQTLYVGDGSNFAVRALTWSGANVAKVSTAAVQPPTGGRSEGTLGFAFAVAADPNGSYVLTMGGANTPTVIKVDPITGAQTLAVGRGRHNVTSLVDAPSGPATAMRTVGLVGVAPLDSADVVVADMYRLALLQLGADQVWRATAIGPDLTGTGTYYAGLARFDGSSVVATLAGTPQVQRLASPSWTPTVLATGFASTANLATVAVVGTDTIFIGDQAYVSGTGYPVYQVTRGSPSWSVQTAFYLPSLPTGLAPTSATDFFFTAYPSTTIGSVSGTGLGRATYSGTWALAGLDVAVPSGVTRGYSNFRGLAMTDSTHLFTGDASYGLMYAHTFSATGGQWSTVAYGTVGQRKVQVGSAPFFNSPKAMAWIPGTSPPEFVLIDQYEQVVMLFKPQ